MAVPDRLSTADPSPQFTDMPVTEPSGSVELNAIVTVEPVLAGFGATLLMVTRGI